MDLTLLDAIVLVIGTLIFFAAMIFVLAFITVDIIHMIKSEGEEDENGDDNDNFDDGYNPYQNQK